MTRILLLATLLLATTGAQSAPTACADGSLTDCMDAISEERSEGVGVYTELSQAAARQVFDAKKALSVSTTGDIPLSVLGNAVSLNDLLPLFSIAVDPGTSGDQDESASISIEYSPVGKTLGGDIKIGATAREPEITDAFKQVIDDNTLVNSLESDFDYSDDIEVSLTYAFEGSLLGMQFGRDFALYDSVADGVLAAAARAADTETGYDRTYRARMVMTVRKAFAAAPQATRARVNQSIIEGPLNALAGAVSAAALELGNSRVGTTALVKNLEEQASNTSAGDQSERVVVDCAFLLAANTNAPVSQPAADAFGQCVYERVVSAAEAHVATGVARTASMNTYLLDNNFFHLSSLVNNQPQLLITANARKRDELAGGDAYSAKLSFEFDMSGHNINNLLGHLTSRRNFSSFGEDCQREAGFRDVDWSALAEACAVEIGKYSASNPVKQGGWRGSLSIEYEDNDEDEITIDGVATPLVLEGGSKIIGSLAVGRQFDALGFNQLPTGKLDIGISYEDVSDDPMRQDRTLGSLTFTQQVAEAFQLTVGVVYADKPEYRPDSGEEWSARISLNYKIPGLGEFAL